MASLIHLGASLVFVWLAVEFFNTQSNPALGVASLVVAALFLGGMIVSVVTEDMHIFGGNGERGERSRRRRR